MSLLIEYDMQIMNLTREVDDLRELLQRVVAERDHYRELWEEIELSKTEIIGGK